MLRVSRLVAACIVLLAAAAAQADNPLLKPWPDPAGLTGIAQQAVTFPSTSPFSAEDAGLKDAAPATQAIGTLFVPPGGRAAGSVPAVVMLHGSGGVLPARELTYGRQLAALGIEALAVDSFGARRDRATGFTDRLIEITESMLVADAYAALDFLAARPEIDPKRVVLVGFSYGAMATTFALNAAVAQKLGPSGRRFAGHVSYYGPCIASFEAPKTTGAPLLAMYGTEDELIDPKRCDETAAELRAGGSRVDIVAYPGAVHQWDGDFARRRIGHDLSPCALKVEPSGLVRDTSSGLPMSNTFFRKTILLLCVKSDPYLIGRDDAVRAKSNLELGRFLTRVFGLGA